MIAALLICRMPLAAGCAALLLAGCATGVPAFSIPALAEKTTDTTPPEPRVAAYNRSALGNSRGVGDARGAFVEVQPGETILDISRRTKVPVSLLMSENKLLDLTVVPGQRLFIPKY